MSATGGCLCGGVRYAVNGPLREVIACHCSQCRRWSGNYVAATRALTADLAFTTAGTLAWHPSSDAAERGFCSRCGSNLFWRRTGSERTWTSIMAGTLDPPTGLRLMRHIFVADKTDYYDIADGAPQHAAWPD
jgi:hypothetical protein